MNILIADDSLLARKILKSHCEEYFEEVKFFEAEDGKEAVDIIYANAIDIFLCDLHMPNFNGESVLNTLRSNKKYRKLKIIMVTTEGSKEIILPLVKKGLNGYVQKPVKKNELFKILERVTYFLVQDALTNEDRIDILICDDSQADRIHIKALLNEKFNNRINFFEAKNGYEALEIINNVPIKLLMLDWNMPIKDGSGVIQAVRNNQQYSDLKIIVVSTAEVKRSLSTEIKQKINGFLEKPVESRKLSNLLETIMQRIKKESVQRDPAENAITLLVADDSKTIRKRLNAIIDDYFITPNILEAEDGFETIELIEDHCVDILFLDYDMPNMNGAGVLEVINALDSHHDMKRVIVTGIHDHATIQKLKKKGIDGFIRKPLNSAVFRKALDAMLLRKR